MNIQHYSIIILMLKINKFLYKCFISLVILYIYLLAGIVEDYPKTSFMTTVMLANFKNTCFFPDTVCHCN